jgi:hypothetical protein
MFENSFGKILKSAFKILNNKKLKVFPQRKKKKTIAVYTTWWWPPKHPCQTVLAATTRPPKIHGGHRRAAGRSWQQLRGCQTFIANR